ncbi:hypothetical protein C2845_PM06G24250 [Panicum miliaceum]|uniref:F-box domain-containing protein n=1 Tax=Panicum miliaceum TaxID=4540 RepID=A0A3L6RD54_PANMI|nr:hypothetical protein C2845_PM06G24250 [Panicum miliaceum]
MDGGVDRLSTLSDDLLRRILHFVPSKEAASTSVLSRLWGSLWRSSGAVNVAVQEAFARAAAAAFAAAEAPVTRLTLRMDTDDYTAIGQFLHRGRGWDTDVDVVGAVLSHHKARHVEDLRVTLANASDALVFLDREIGWSPGIHSLVSLPSSRPSACWTSPGATRAVGLAAAGDPTATVLLRAAQGSPGPGGRRAGARHRAPRVRLLHVASGLEIPPKI